MLGSLAIGEFGGEATLLRVVFQALDLFEGLGESCL